MSPHPPPLSVGLLFLLLLGGLTIVNAATNNQDCENLLLDLKNGTFPITGIAHLNDRIILTTPKNLFNLPATDLHSTALYITRSAEPFPDDRPSMLLQLTDTYLEVAHPDLYFSIYVQFYRHPLENLKNYQYLNKDNVPGGLLHWAFISATEQSTIWLIDLTASSSITKYTIRDNGQFRPYTSAKRRYICNGLKPFNNYTFHSSTYLVMTTTGCSAIQLTPYSLPSSGNTFLGFISNSKLYLFDSSKMSVKIIDWPEVIDEDLHGAPFVYYTEVSLVQFFICGDLPTDWLMLVFGFTLLFIVGVILLIVWIGRRRKCQQQFAPKVEYLVGENKVAVDLAG